MRIIQRLGSIGVALLIPIVLSTGAFAQTDSPVNINAADAATLAKAIDGGDFQGRCRVNHSRSLSFLLDVLVPFRVEPHLRRQRPVADLA